MKDKKLWWEIEYVCKVRDKETGARCGKVFTLFSPTQKHVCTKHLVELGKAKTQREMKARVKETTWFQELNRVKVKAQKVARLRDKDLPCISCGATTTYLWQGSHFYPAKMYKTLALNLDNIHRSCFVCNKHQSGNIANYKPALIKKIGLERFNELELLANLEKQMSKVIISKEEIRLREIELDEMIKQLKGE